MVHRLVTVGNLQERVFLVRPRSVVVHGDAHAEAERTERGVEERVRQNAVLLGAEGRGDLELGGIGFGGARGQEHLTPRDRERVGDRAGGTVGMWGRCSHAPTVTPAPNRPATRR